MIDDMKKSSDFRVKDADSMRSIWEPVLAFAMGADPIEHQLEKTQDGVYAVSDSALEVGTLGVPTIPLDQESDHIKHQNQGLYGKEVGY